MNDPGTAVCLTDIVFTYPDQGKAGFTLDVPALTLPAGICTALSGFNGSGKTTLGKLLTGLLRPVRGKVLLGGEDIADWPLGKIGARVGYLFQDPSRQIFAPTVIEDVAFPLILKGKSEGEAYSLARSILARFELDSLEEATSYTLSRGEKQRLALAAMMINNPSFFVLDEPTTGLDVRRKSILGDVLKDLTGCGAGILLISHDKQFIRDYAGAVYMMEEGRLLTP